MSATLLSILVDVLTFASLAFLAERLRDEWKPWKAWCLLIGTAAGALAALLALIDHSLTYFKC